VGGIKATMSVEILSFGPLAVDPVAEWWTVLEEELDVAGSAPGDQVLSALLRTEWEEGQNKKYFFEA
jgi:hypothetical protein